MNLLAIDPDTKDGPACAFFENGRLTRAEFVWLPDGAGLDVIVVERMQADARTRDIDVRGLLDCQFAGGLAAGYALGSSHGNAELVHLTPTEWKGSIPKPVHHADLWFSKHAEACPEAMTATHRCKACGVAAILDDAERAILGGEKTGGKILAAVEKGALSRWSKAGADYYPRKFVTHNLLDAAALGCTHLGRMKRR